jgi:hypothetical protein
LVVVVKLVGLDSDELAGVIGVVAGSVAAYLLPPGDVVAAPVVETGSDALLPPAVQARLSE